MATFDDVLDWLGQRVGSSVYLEVGVHDPTIVDRDYSYFPVALHVVIGRWSLGEHDYDGHGIVYLPVEGHERSRLFLDPERVTKLTVRTDVVKIEFLDSIYVSMSGSPLPDSPG